MKYIDKLEELKGKTIERALTVDCGEKMAIVFTDNSYTVVSEDRYGESFDMRIDEEPDNSDKVIIGAMTQQEFDLIKRESSEHWERQRKERDIKELKRLQGLYGADL